jgi:Raf kinase inhibitor-like YbhB/YbcL family protein
MKNLIFLGIFLFLTVWGDEKMIIKSNSFKNMDLIPVEFTCDGIDISPQINWEKIEGAKSYVIIMDDPDAPMGLFTHWIVYDIPKDITSLPANFPKKKVLNSIKQGINDFGFIGYGGPCPPKGKPHRYFFKVYALDIETLGIPHGTTRKEVETKMRSHIISSGQLVGIYGR